MGTVLPGVLSGHWRYAHIKGVRGDGVNPGLPGMNGTVSEDAVRSAMYRIPETTGLAGCGREFMSYPAAKGNTGVPPVLASGHTDRCKSLVGGTPATRHSRDGHVPLHEKAVAPGWTGFPYKFSIPSPPPWG